MSRKVIEIENLSKQYRLGVVGTGTLSHDLNRWWAKVRKQEDPSMIIGVNKQHSHTDANYVWALKDVSFDILQGEVVGIIGRNGAGKSTLLKIISKITAPTTGTIKVKGKVASLLEVGTGFHHELTGRENIYLNGAILGMSKSEINRKFDEIVEFSGVGKYIDTPVKRYSSGMFVRLAFAVAAHLDSEILIVDEVLAVGDIEFQRKCLGKMSSVAKDGRTVLFVSHNMASISALCNSVVVLDKSTIAMAKSDVKSGIDYYYNTIVGQLLNFDFTDRKDRDGSGKLRLTSLSYLNNNNDLLKNIVTGDSFKIRLYYSANVDLTDVIVSIGINSWSGESKMVLRTDLVGQNYNVKIGNGYFETEVTRLPLSTGEYLINLFVQANGEILDWIKEAVSLSVDEGDFFGTGKSVAAGYNTVLVGHKWTPIK